MIKAETSGATTPRVGTRPRLGFAGLGWIGRHRMQAIAGDCCGDVAGIFDISEEAARAAAKAVPGAEVAPSFEELLQLELDGVVIATPNALHAEQAIAALERGLAVFCQKPLGRDARETCSVLAAARENNRLLRVDLSYRSTKGMEEIRRLIASGALGRIYAVTGVFHNAYGPDKSWFYDPRKSGGGCLLDLGVHLVDLTLWSLGFPHVTNVAGHLLTREPAAAGPHGVEDYAAAQLLLASGTSVQLACSWRAPAGCDADIRMTFFGTGGGAEFANVDGSFYDFTAVHLLPDRSRRMLASPPDAWGGRAAIAWCRQLEITDAFDPEVEHLAAVAETLDRIYGRIP